MSGSERSDAADQWQALPATGHRDGSHRRGAFTGSRPGDAGHEAGQRVQRGHRVTIADPGPRPRRHYWAASARRDALDARPGLSWWSRSRAGARQELPYAAIRVIDTIGHERQRGTDFAPSPQPDNEMTLKHASQTLTTHLEISNYEDTTVSTHLTSGEKLTSIDDQRKANKACRRSKSLI